MRKKLNVLGLDNALYSSEECLLKTIREERRFYVQKYDENSNIVAIIMTPDCGVGIRFCSGVGYIVSLTNFQTIITGPRPLILRTYNFRDEEPIIQSASCFDILTGYMFITYQNYQRMCEHPVTQEDAVKMGIKSDEFDLLIEDADTLLTEWKFYTPEKSSFKIPSNKL